MSRRIIASHRLPLRCSPDPSSQFQFSFSLDLDSLPLQLSSSLPSTAIFVGTLPPPLLDAPPLSDELTDYLFSQFNCLPVFIPSQLHHDFYDRFCKRYFWPLLHSVLLISDSCYIGGLPFDRSMYSSFLNTNKLFADHIIDIINVQEDFVWVHDYHLIALATFLRKKLPCVKIGFYLHSPFPTSEIFRTIPVRDDLLCGLLNFDMVGFQTYDYARHFLSSCLRVLGVRYQSKRGYISLEYHGRNIIVKILPVGVDMNQLRAVLTSHETISKIVELNDTYQNQVLMVGVDDVDVFKGVALKFLAIEKLLEKHPKWQGRVVLVQITNPARSEGKAIQGVQDETRFIRQRINTRFGKPGYEPIVVIEDRPVPMYEKAAFCAVAECCIMNAVRDGLNRIPYTYTVCRELNPTSKDGAKKSAIVVSEFIGCSPSLSGAIRVNPWDIESVSEGMVTVLSMSNMDKQFRHELHYKYINSHDVVYWAQSFDQVLQKACEEHASGKNYYFLGLGMSFRVVALGMDFEKLSLEKVVTSYNKTRLRLILLDYDGTLVPEGVTDKRPTEEVIAIVKGLCADPLNVVILVSGRGKEELAQWFEPCKNLGIAAEHGYYFRWNRELTWTTTFCNSQSPPFDWMDTVMPLMRMYTEATYGSYIESKDSALVWNYEDADPDFGSCQAKELLENLETVLANEPAVVKKGNNIVEVNAQGISKGVVVDKIIDIKKRCSSKPLDFVLCIGDDSSDEDMFEAIKNGVPELAEVFACTVGNKPSMAKYYLEDTGEVLKMLKALVKADLSTSQTSSSESQFSLSELH